LVLVYRVKILEPDDNEKRISSPHITPEYIDT